MTVIGFGEESGSKDDFPRYQRASASEGRQKRNDAATGCPIAAPFHSLKLLLLRCYQHVSTG